MSSSKRKILILIKLPNPIKLCLFLKNKLNYLKKKKKIIKNNNKLIIYKKKLLVMMKKQNFSQEIVLDLLKYCAWRTKKNLSGFS